MSQCLCGESPDPGVRPGGGCYCLDRPACEHGCFYGRVCDQCVRESAQRTFDAAGQGSEALGDALIALGLALAGEGPTK